MKKRIGKAGISFILIFLLICSNTFAVLGESSTSSALEKNIDDYVNEHQNTTAALSVAVFDNQSVWFQKAYGYADKEKSLKADADTVYEWGSVSKLLVWTSVMQLWEQGKIDLDENIQSYLPDGFLKKLKYDTPITMLNLMNHNAGWQEVFSDSIVKDKADIRDLGETLRETEPPQVYRPGTVCAYSNWGAALAAYIVERISGQSFSDYVHKHIFEPLGMEHTALSATLSDNEWVRNKRAELKCYKTDNTSMGESLNYISLYPAGMATGTLGDFLSFARALLPGDNETTPLFCSNDTLNEMFSPTLFFGNTDSARNCHGFWKLQFGTAVIGHGGNTKGCSSYLLIDTSLKKGAVVMTNQSGEWVYNEGMMPLIFGEYSPEAADARSDAKELNGIYMSGRVCLKGCFKLSSLLYSRCVMVKDDHTLCNPITGNTLAEQFAPNTYLITQGNVKSVLYTQTYSDGSVNLQFVYGDYIKVNTGEAIAKAVLLLFAAVSILYCIITLMINLIGFVRKIRRKDKRFNKEQLYRNIVRGDVAVIGVNIMIFILRTFSFATTSALKIHLVLDVVLSIMPVLYTVYLIVKWKKLNCTKGQKASYLLTALAGLLMIINVIFWELY